MKKFILTTKFKFSIILLVLGLLTVDISAQRDVVTHTRGKLWETLISNGLIGSAGAWDYQEVTGLGFYPGFKGYYFPNDEQLANSPDKVTNANFHNFRSGPWIIAKNPKSLEPPDFSPKQKDFLMYHSSLTPTDYGTIQNYNAWEGQQNFSENAGFDPLLPEEMFYNERPTVTGITVKQRSMVWSVPGYSDFIIYDYIFKNTGDMVIPSLNKTMKYDQTLDEVWFVFHSGISVSTKGILNFHYDPNSFISSAGPAGGFGGYGGKPGSDVYQFENRSAGDGKGLLYFSRDFNGGREPVPWDLYAKKNNWEDILRLKPEWLPELQDPACFGFVFLYRTPFPGAAADPFDADPAYFSVYNDQGDNFKGKDLDFNEYFGFGKFQPPFFYDFAKHEYQRPNDGTLYAWYTSSFGPYKLAPGDSVRLMVAEVAGQLDLKDVAKGDPNRTFPDSSIAAIIRNAQAARNAVKWGYGSKVNGKEIFADVPEAPPAPNVRAANASRGSDTAVIAIQWDKLAEEAKIMDGANKLFFDGSTDLSGYRVYRGSDERGIWDLIADIPKGEFHKYWNAEAERYEFLDKNLQFGFEFFYYVEAYNLVPKPWTSSNGTLVNKLPELKSADINRTELTSAKPGPIDLSKIGWDVFVVPNPFIEGDANHSFGEPNPRKIEFRNLPEKAKILVFNIAGELVKTLDHGPDSRGNLAGSVAWDQQSDSGLLVAPGLYIFVVESETDGTIGQRDTGKFMIIR
ncbi:MAG: hypothetical protein M0P71_14010 [Melioribacteraceae bacterium]|nr:hypothetical protein [Melioribacteraceae bacterium]